MGRVSLRLSILAAGLLSISQLTISGSHAAPTAGRPQAAAFTRVLLAAINHDRALHGLRPLLLNRTQSRCSLQHSVHMAQQGAVSHDQFPADICVAHGFAGENVAQSPDASTAAVLGLHRWMMQEGPCPGGTCRTPAQFQDHGHYVNLMDPSFRHIGIGMYVHDGNVWLTEDFSN